jgi:pimeloyl-ACP methyl ester carboxylesterase
MRSPVRTWIPLLLALLAVSACTSEESPGTPAASPVSPTSPSLSPPVSPAPIRSAGLAQRCGAPDVPSTLHRIRSTDGVTLSAASIGTGPRAVVLLHQSDGNACGWWSFGGPWLAGQGYRVLMLELRCFGESTCPRSQRIGERLADVRVAVAWLRATGARTVSVVGVSMGGAIAVAAGADPRIGADAVVDVSGELTSTPVQASPPLSARDAVPRLRSRLLYLTADQDLGVDHTADLALLARAPTGRVTATVVPGSGDHGWALLSTDGHTATRWARDLEAFLRTGTG